MNTDELARGNWAVTKDLLAVVKKQNALLEYLFKEHTRLMEFLRSEAGLEPATPEQERAREKIRSEIEQLDKMFNAPGEENDQPI